MASASQCFCWHVPLTSLANQLSKQSHVRGLFPIHTPLVGWGRGDTAASTHAAWRGRPHASYALEREGRDTIWLNGLFRDFAVHNVLAGKIAIG